MSSPGKSINSSAKKRKSVEPTQDDRFSSFLSQPDTNDDDQDDKNDQELDSLSSFPKQKPLPAHLLPKHHQSTSSSSTSTSKPKSTKQPGLIYLSRIPPGMGPGKVKHLLSQFGEVGRIYLARADSGKGKLSPYPLSLDHNEIADERMRNVSYYRSEFEKEVQRERETSES